MPVKKLKDLRHCYSLVILVSLKEIFMGRPVYSFSKRVRDEHCISAFGELIDPNG